MGILHTSVEHDQPKPPADLILNGAAYTKEGFVVIKRWVQPNNRSWCQHGEPDADLTGCFQPPTIECCGDLCAIPSITMGGKKAKAKPSKARSSQMPGTKAKQQPKQQPKQQAKQRRSYIKTS